MHHPISQKEFSRTLNGFICLGAESELGKYVTLILDFSILDHTIGAMGPSGGDHGDNKFFDILHVLTSLTALSEEVNFQTSHTIQDIPEDFFVFFNLHAIPQLVGHGK